MPRAPLRLPRRAGRLLARLRDAAAASGQPLWVTGGFVRDQLLGRAPKPELDLTLPSPRALLDALGRDPGETAFALDAGRETFRLVLPPRAGLGHVDLTRLRAATIEEDLRLRDFTVNAVAHAIDAGAPGPAVDPTGGVADCRRRLLRACGPRSIADDPLRALRGVRFAAGLGLSVEPGTLRLLARARPGLAQVSAERVRDELFRILAGPAPEAGIALALRLGLLAAVGLPHRAGERLARLRRLGRVAAALPPRGALRRALAEQLELEVTRLGVARLCALLLDLGRGGEAGRLCARLLLGSRAARACATAAAVRFPRLGAAPAAARAHLLDFHRAAGHAAAEIILLGARDAAGAAAREARYRSARRLFQRPPLLTGTIAMRDLGLAPGRELGRVLAATRRAQDLGQVRTAAGALAFARALRRP
jgi:hypothetical protein